MRNHWLLGCADASLSVGLRSVPMIHRPVPRMDLRGKGRPPCPAANLVPNPVPSPREVPTSRNLVVFREALRCERRTWSQNGGHAGWTTRCKAFTSFRITGGGRATGVAGRPGRLPFEFSVRTAADKRCGGGRPGLRGETLALRRLDHRHPAGGRVPTRPPDRPDWRVLRRAARRDPARRPANAVDNSE